MNVLAADIAQREARRRALLDHAADRELEASTVTGGARLELQAEARAARARAKELAADR